MGRHIKDNLQTILSAINLFVLVVGGIWFAARVATDVEYIKRNDAKQDVRIDATERSVTIIETRMGMKDAKQ